MLRETQEFIIIDKDNKYWINVEDLKE